MDSSYPYTTTPAERARRRAERIAQRKARERARRRRALMRVVPVAVLVLVIVGAAVWALSGEKEPAPPVSTPQQVTEPSVEKTPVLPEPEPEENIYTLSPDAQTRIVGSELPSSYAIVIDLTENRILAVKNAYAVISPASMTKILTLLTVADYVTDPAMLQDTVTIDMDITNYCFSNGCSVAGFEREEAVPVEELLYGAILPSGAEACLALAEYVAGSHEAFVTRMNEKAAELGISDTASFTNCVGLYDENNCCTVYDMALILKAAMENDLCRQILSTKVREIAPNAFHEEGMILSNWFIRRIEDHLPTGIEIRGAKTGYVEEAGNCAASCAAGPDGREYICVTADAESAWQCIRDHVALYTDCIEH